MSNNIGKKRKKSVFEQHLALAAREKRDKQMTEEERKEARYKKLDVIFDELGNKQNRYLFYCPDVPFANSMVKVIYEYAYMLQNMGYNTTVLHEVKGFKPEWLKYDWIKDVKKGYLSERKKQGGHTNPVWDFKPTDTIIIPDGFWEIMRSIYEVKMIHKVVLCFGFSGLGTIDPGISWAHAGITDVICMSEQIKQDYEALWPNMNYYVTGYELAFDKLTPVEKTEQKPIIGLMTRSREDAQQIINLFYAKYPFLDLFQFKVLKKLDTNNYLEAIRQCIVIVFVDEKAGYPAPPIEALFANVPVIAPYGRGMSHLVKEEGVIWMSSNDNFLITEQLAGFCLDWLEKIPEPITHDRDLFKAFIPSTIQERMLNVMNDFQEHKIKLFTAVKNAVDEGKLDDKQLDITN